MAQKLCSKLNRSAYLSTQVLPLFIPQAKQDTTASSGAQAPSQPGKRARHAWCKLSFGFSSHCEALILCRPKVSLDQHVGRCDAQASQHLAAVGSAYHLQGALPG